MVIGVIPIVAGLVLLLVVRLLRRVEARSVPYALDWLVRGLRVVLAVVALMFMGGGIFLVARPPRSQPPAMRETTDKSTRSGAAATRTEPR